MSETLVIHKVKEVRITPSEKFELEGKEFYWQKIEIITLDGRTIGIDLESDKPLTFSNL